jgi:hypothetical protein
MYTALHKGIIVFRGTLQEVVEFIRGQESTLDRYTQHSPWTVGVERN